MATFGYLWLLLVTFGCFWLLLATFGYVLVTFGYHWLLWATLGYFWQFLATLAYFLLLLAKFCYSWINLDNFEKSLRPKTSITTKNTKTFQYVLKHSKTSQEIWARNNMLVQPVVFRRARHLLTGNILFQTYFCKIIRRFEKLSSFVPCSAVHCSVMKC